MFSNLPRSSAGLLVNALNIARQSASLRVAQTRAIIAKHAEAIPYLDAEAATRRRNELREAERELTFHERDEAALAEMLTEATGYYAKAKDRIPEPVK